MSDQNRSFERSGQEQDGQQAHNSHCHAPGRRRLDRPIQFGTAPHVAPLQTAFELVFTADDARFVLANNKLVATPGYAAQLLGLTNVVASGQGTFTNPNSGPSADSGQPDNILLLTVYSFAKKTASSIPFTNFLKEEMHGKDL
ncbi:hypothetical protein JADG_003636 [Aureobasidium aubasidani]|nr:hypothetical protein JADG_003636 [Aureobasidium pullulans]